MRAPAPPGAFVAHATGMRHLARQLDPGRKRRPPPLPELTAQGAPLPPPLHHGVSLDQLFRREPYPRGRMSPYRLSQTRFSSLPPPPLPTAPLAHARIGQRPHRRAHPPHRWPPLASSGRRSIQHPRSQPPRRTPRRSEETPLRRELQNRCDMRAPALPSRPGGPPIGAGARGRGPPRPRPDRHPRAAPALERHIALELPHQPPHRRHSPLADQTRPSGQDLGGASFQCRGQGRLGKGHPQFSSVKTTQLVSRLHRSSTCR